MNRHTMATRPVVSSIVLINPEQAIHVAHIRLEHDPTHVVVYTHRAHVRISGVTNTLVVDAARHGVLPELGYEIQHGQLLRTWHCSKGLEKVIGHRDFRGQCHARVSIRILRNESGNTSPSARKQCHPLLLNTARVSVYWGRKTATFTSGQASSASASTHCLASSSSKPGTGTLTPMDANARHQGTSSEATISKASNQPDVTSTCCSEGLSSNANSPGISALPAHRRRNGS